MFAPVQTQLPSVVARAAAADASLFRPGQVLDALVLGKAPDGMVALKIGDVVVTAQLPQVLPPGTTLQLQVKTGGPSPQLAIVGTPQLPVAQAAPALVVPQAPVLVAMPQDASAPVLVAAGPPAQPAAPAVAAAPIAASTQQTMAIAPATPQATAPPVPGQAAPRAGLSQPVPAQVAPQAPISASTNATAPTPIIESGQPVVTPAASSESQAPPSAPPAPAVARPAAPLAPAPTASQAAEVTQPAVSGPATVAQRAVVTPPAAQPDATLNSGASPVPTPPAVAPSGPVASMQGPAAPTPRVAVAQVAVPAEGQPQAQLSVPPATVSGSQVPLAVAAPQGLQPATAVPAAGALPPQAQRVPQPVAAQVVAAPASPAVPPPEPDAASPLLLAQGAPRAQPTAADLPRPVVLPPGSPQVGAQHVATTPAAALTQMVPEAMARQNSLAPLMASLATLIARPGAIPEPVMRAAMQVLGQRVSVPPSGPTAQTIESALAKSGVYLEAGLAKGHPAADLKSALVALKSAAATWLGGNPAPVTQAQQPAPPLRGLPPRIQASDLPPLPEAPREAARALHSQADAGLSRVKLMQLASLPDADPMRAPMPELRMEVPFLIGQQLVMAQFQVLRDREQQKSDGRRGWTMRFAMNFADAGEVGAEIGLLGHSVNVALWAANPETAANLEAALPELAPALSALGLEPGAVRVRSMPPDFPKPVSGHFVDSRR